MIEHLENRTLLAANLLVNGDFEIPQIGAGSTGQGYSIYAAGATVGSGWLVTTGNVDIQSNAAGAKYATTAAHGNQWLDINGSELGAIAQVVPTVVGTKYTIQLSYTTNPFVDNISATIRQMSLLANTTLLATLAKSPAAGETPSNLGWQAVSYSFTATTKLTTISFVSLTPGDEGIGIDNVSMVAAATKLTLNAPAAQTAPAGVSTPINLGSFTETNATGPYTATVVWGDGSANSTIKLTAAGTIPATAHTFASSGNKTVSITVADSAGHSSSKATFSVAVSASTTSISGTVFNDANGNGKKDPGEEGLGLWKVYLDLKKDGNDDAGDPTVTTNILGAWSFTGLAAGTYIIRVVPVTGSVATTPAGGVKTITLTAGQSSVGNLFGEKTTA
jgi:hypothetical protein